MSSCVNCGAICNKLNLSTHCDGCQGVVHLTCVGLSENEFKLTRAKSKSIKVVCNGCNSNMAQFSDIKNLIASLRNEFSSAITQLRNEFNARLESLGPSTGDSAPSGAELEDVVREVMDRQARRNNLVLFGVPEQSSAQTGEQRGVGDRAVITDILAKVKPGYQFQFQKFHRLGRLNQVAVRPRPLKIVFNEEADVHDIIRNAKILRTIAEHNNVVISYDRTPKQLELYQSLKRELDDRLSKGETNLKIRYRNGVPKIYHLN